MIKIDSATHDWVQIEVNGRYYELSLKHDGLTEDIEWRAELEMIREAKLEELKKKYVVQEIPKKKARHTGIADMELVRWTHGIRQ